MPAIFLQIGALLHIFSKLMRRFISSLLTFAFEFKPEPFYMVTYHAIIIYPKIFSFIAI